MQHEPEDKSCTSYVISDGLTGIAERAFYGCSALTSIEIPNNVTVIGESVFKDCNALKTVKVPKLMEVNDWGLCDDVQVIYY